MNLADFKEELKKKKPLTDMLKKEDYCTEEGIAKKIVDEGYIKTMNQLRDFFEPIDRLYEGVKLEDATKTFDHMSNLLPLHFELINRVARGVVKKEFYELIKAIIHRDVLKTYADFFCFHEMLSAIIAFQKYKEAVEKGGEA